MSEGVNLIQIARIVKSNGTEGQLLMSFRDIMPDDIDIQEPVFIYADGLPVPFFIENIVPKGTDKAFVKFADIDSYADAEELVGQPVYADSESYEDLSEEDDEFADLIGWSLLDSDSKKVGIISDFEDIPGNPCLYVDTDNGQVMIPVHEELILSIDENRRELTMKIPEGLIR